MKVEIYRATDNLDGCDSYFAFNEERTACTIVYDSVPLENLIRAIKRRGLDWFEDVKPRFNMMINPQLVCTVETDE